MPKVFRKPRRPSGVTHDGVAPRHPFHPAEIEVARRHRRPDRPRDVWASLGPIEAEPARVTAGRARCGKLDPELPEEPEACRGDVSSFVVVDHDVFSGDERIGEIDAETAREVVVADPGRAQRACLPRERTVARSLLKSDGDDPVDHVGHGRRGKAEIAMPASADHREQARLCQLREMRAGGLRRDARRQGQVARGQGPAIEKRG